jgi:hypothetical protein
LPSNYLGPQAVFGEEPKVAPLREIDDADLTFPYGHKSTLLVEALPPTLEDAARTFLLSTTIRDLRGEGPSHRSMLVNVSRFTAVQDQVAMILHTWLSQVQQDIRNYSQLPPSAALRNESLKALYETWQKEFSDRGFAWSAVQAGLVNGALPVVIQAVNQRTGAASLDYAKHRENGLRVIAVGGNSLSRGLTLEGLSTSYFFRNSQMYDTLLQMGRWFGYRDGYDDLCRVWLTDDAMHWYAHITMATDELRAEFRRMRQQDRTPKDFGLKVRAHPDSLIVTAQNKMRQSKLVERVISISGESLETPRLKTNENVLRANKITVERFLEGLRAEGRRVGESRLHNPFWRAVPKEHVVGLLRSFDVHPMNISFQSRDLADFLDATTEERLQEWDVVLPQGEGDGRELGGVTVRRNKRKVTLQLHEGSILVSGRSARVGSRGIEREGLSEEQIREVVDAYKQDEKNKGKSVPDHKYREKRERPLLLIHVIEPSVDDADEKKLPGDLIALGLSFPKFNDADVAKRVTYRVNLVEYNAMVEHEIDDQVEDEAAVDDAG